MPRILIVEDDRSIRHTLEELLRELNYDVVSAADGQKGLDLLLAGGIDLCLLDMGLPGLDGMGVLRRLQTLKTEGTYVDHVPVLVVSARDDMSSTIDAIKLGAYDFLLKPFDVERLELTIRRALEQRATQQALAHFITEEKEDFSARRMVGKSEAIRQVFKTVGAVAPTRTTVLLRGESGTGKELVARAIHFASTEEPQPFVAVNCTAFARDLLESELFGHLKGAFTGAVSDKLGRFQQAGSGTLFLDEIGEMPLELQAKLLRVLQERTFERVGDIHPLPLQARVITATHRDLERMVKEGTFREDLFYRLRVVEITLPPLRERKEDLPDLLDALLTKVNREVHSRVRFIEQRAMDRILAYAWPGNVRELENALTRACVLTKGDVLLEQHLALDVQSGTSPPKPLPKEGVAWLTLRDLERNHIVQVLHHTSWNKRQSCTILGITRPTLDRKIKEFQLERAVVEQRP